MTSRGKPVARLVPIAGVSADLPLHRPAAIRGGFSQLTRHSVSTPSAETIDATHLLETELRRFASRHDLPQADVSEILSRVDLHDLPPSLYREAGLLPGPALRSLDTLHLAASIRLDVEALVTYDARLAGAAREWACQSTRQEPERQRLCGVSTAESLPAAPSSRTLRM